MNDMELRKKIIYFHRRISQIPIGIISLGSILHPDIVSWPKLPFVGPLRNGILRNFFFLLQFHFFCIHINRINSFFRI